MTEFHDCDQCHMRSGSASARLAGCRCHADVLLEVANEEGI